MRRTILCAAMLAVSVAALAQTKFLGSNIPPIAVNDEEEITQGGSELFQPGLNDTDADGSIELNSLELEEGAGFFGELDIILTTSEAAIVVRQDYTNGFANYVHLGGNEVSDSFSYRIRDDSGALSNVATVDITIDPAATAAGGGDTPVPMGGWTHTDDAEECLNYSAGANRALAMFIIGRDGNAGFPADLQSATWGAVPLTFISQHPNVRVETTFAIMLDDDFPASGSCLELTWADPVGTDTYDIFYGFFEHVDQAAPTDNSMEDSGTQHIINPRFASTDADAIALVLGLTQEDFLTSSSSFAGQTEDLVSTGQNGSDPYYAIAGIGYTNYWQPVWFNVGERELAVVHAVLLNGIPDDGSGEEALTYATGAYTDWTSNFTIADATVTDPAVADGIAGGNSFYVCDTGGNDANDGLLTSRGGTGPWATIDKVEAQTFGPGDYVLFCRDGVWTSTLTMEGTVAGAEGNHAVFGAYGPVADDPPQLNLTDWADVSYLTVRDLNMQRFGVDGNDGPTNYSISNLTIFNNIIRGTTGISNCAMVVGVAEFIIIARNLGYDCGNNDIFGVHADINSEGQYLGVVGKVWVIDNIGIGGSTMEDCFDLTGTADDDAFSDPTEDIKAVLNKCMGADLPGLSTQTGWLFSCFQNNHQNQYIWIMWNLCGEVRQRGYVGVSGGIANKHGYFAANVFVSESDNEGPSGTSPGNHYDESTITVEHLTHMHQISTREIATWNGTNFNNNRNIFWYVHATHNSNCFAGTATFTTSDNNHYNSENGSDTCTLTNARNFTGDDTNSTFGAIPGMSLPNWVTWEDPRDWDQQAFRDHFIPDAGWARSDGANTPGMFDENGDLTVTTIPPITGLGCGWNGGPLVADILARHGVNGC